MVLSQGALGYALTSVMGPIVVEIFEGPRFGSIFGTITVASIGGGAAGPWVAGVLHDTTGSYRIGLPGGDRLLRHLGGRHLARVSAARYALVPGRMAKPA